MSWDLKPFGELYAIPSRNGLSLPADQRGHGCKMINMGELFAYPKIKNPEMARVQPSENETVKYAVEKDDLLFARRSLVLEGAGKCAIVAEHEYPTVFESSIIRVRLNKEICDPAFYFYFFGSQAGFGFIQQIVNQVAVAGIRGSDLERMKIIYPPLPFQQKIAAILSAYDDLIETNNKRIALLEKAAEEIYREWFVRLRFPGWEKVKFVKGVPEGWEIRPFSEVVKLKPTEKVDKNTPMPFASMGDLSTTSMMFSFSEIRIDGSGTKFRNRDTLFPRITPSVENGKRGYVMNLDENQIGLGSTEFIVFRVKVLSSEFIYFTTCLPEFRKHAELSMTGASGRQRVQEDCFDYFLVKVPDEKTLKRFTDIVEPFLQKIKAMYKSNFKLQQSRDLLLSRLISGKLPVEGLDIRFPPNMQADALKRITP